MIQVSVNVSFGLKQIELVVEFSGNRNSKFLQIVQIKEWVVFDYLHQDLYPHSERWTDDRSVVSAQRCVHVNW